jgi:hypothetical protein
MIREIGLVEAKKKFIRLLVLTASRGERFSIEREEKAVAALIGLEDLEQRQENWN